MVVTKEVTFRKEEDSTSQLVVTEETVAEGETTTTTTVLQPKGSQEGVVDRRSISAAKVTLTTKNQAKSKTNWATINPSQRISTSLRMMKMMRLYSLSSKTNHHFRNLTISSVYLTTSLKITNIFVSRFEVCPTAPMNARLETSLLTSE